MKQKFIYILLGFFIATTIAAGTMAVTTVKPAVPRKTIVKEFDNSRNAVEYANASVAKGWIIKTISTSQSSSAWTTTIVVLETY
jgi:hypothetical protein